MSPWRAPKTGTPTNMGNNGFMTRSVGVHEAKTHLCRLLAKVAAGHAEVIATRGVAVARLIPVTNAEARTLGSDRGVFEVPEDFDAPLPDEVLDAFEA